MKGSNSSFKLIKKKTTLKEMKKDFHIISPIPLLSIISTCIYIHNSCCR